MAQELVDKINAATTRLGQINDEMQIELASAQADEESSRKHRRRYDELKKERAELGIGLAHNQVINQMNLTQEATTKALASAEESKKAAAESQAKADALLKKLEEREKEMTALIEASTKPAE